MGTLIKPSSTKISRTTKNDDVTLFVQDWGQGKPIVLIHGWPLSSEMWEYQARSLVEKGFRVISYDRRGFGKSSKPFNGYSYDYLASDLNDLMTQLELQDATLVGFSMGGGEIARYLSRYGSGRVEKAILVSSIVPYMLETDENPHGISEEFFDGMQSKIKEDRPLFIAEFAKDFYGVGMISSPVSEEMLDWTFQLAMQASPKATIECVTSFGKTDFHTDLAAFTMPTLIIHGTDDKIVPIKATSEEAAKFIPGATFKTYEGAPHGLFITHKDELLEDISSFAGALSHIDHLKPSPMESTFERRF